MADRWNFSGCAKGARRPGARPENSGGGRACNEDGQAADYDEMRIHGGLLAGESGAGKTGREKLGAKRGQEWGWTRVGADAILSRDYGKWHPMRKILKRPTEYPAGLSDSAGTEAFLSPASRAEPAALAELSRHGYSEDEIFALVVPKRTLARRRAANERLTIEETDKALRLARIAVQAERVFGEADKAHRWLRKAKRALQGETPLAYLASEAGARVVEEMLHRVEHGVFA